MKLVEAFTTVATMADAERLAELAVNQGLAACAQIVPLKSVYRWQGALQRDDEFQIGFKTTEAASGALRRAVLAAHPYELPAWTVLPVLAADQRFAAWVAESCTSTTAIEGER